MGKFLSDLIARFQFWYAKKTIRLDRDFCLVESDGIGIRILRGKYKGTVFALDNLRLKEQGEEAFLTYDITLLKNPLSVAVEDDNLIKVVNKIVRIILSESVKDEVSRNEQRRNADSDESLFEREVREESPPVPQKRVPSRKPRAKTVSSDSTVHAEVQQPPKRGRPKTTGGRAKRADRA